VKRRFVPLLADLAAALSVLVALVAWLIAPWTLSVGPLKVPLRWHWTLLAVPPALAFLGRGVREWRRRHDLPDVWPGLGRAVRRGSPSLATLFLAVLAVEGFLQVTGFHADLPPIVIKGTELPNRERDDAIIPDRGLRWKFNPGREFNGRRINALGFPDREVDPVKKAGVKRVICMGDSVTGQGPPPYSLTLHQMLTNAPPDGAVWEAFNMAVHGYSSVQGLRLFQERGKLMRPDVVTILYGWNDHWRDVQTDSARMAMRFTPRMAAVMERLRKRRFVLLLFRAANPARHITRHERTDGVDMGVRVPAEEYRWALAKYVAEVRSVGALPILITAPRHQPLSELLVENGQALSVDKAQRLHDEYVEITRDVARKTDTILLDLYEEFRDPACQAWFQGDGIHFLNPGREHIARRVYDTLRAAVAQQRLP
jgi:lysophospholipase L1-like esterase